ncbi:MAG: helicase-related protein [Candidatus Hadarchaeota archaeon]
MALNLMENPLLRKELIQQRDYQNSIASEAVKKNTLVVLPTALGKTVIAALMVAEFLYNHRRHKVLIMAPTRPLVLQHRDTFLKFLKIRPEDAEILTGRAPPNYRLNAWGGPARLYFATPQVVHNDSESGLSLKDFSLLVFDECHRARKNYSYTKVAQAYVRDSQHPMILGTTASPGAEKMKIEEICKALFIEHVEARTEDDEDVKPYVSPVALEWKFAKLPESYGPVRDAIKKALERRLSSLAKMGVIRKHPKYIFRRDLVLAGDELMRRLKAGPWNRGMLFGALGLQSSALTLYHAMELLESQGPHTFRDFMDRVKRSEKRSHKGVVKELEAGEVLDLLESLEDHPKMRMLEELVLGQVSSNKNSKIMVFTQYRATAASIVSRLSELGVSARRFVGQADREGEAGMSQEEQAETLDKFREGEFNAIVATSIGEEGLDVPNVDLVLFYEPVPSEIRYIQRKGRTGRGSFGKVVILAAEGTLDVAYLQSSKKMAEKMKRAVKKLNSELQPILRTGPPPEVDRMTLDEISAEAPPEPISELDEEKLRFEQREFGRNTRKAAEKLLEKTLRRGRDGLSLDEVVEDPAERGVMKEALGRLVEEEQVEVVGGRILPRGASEPTKQDTHTFEVEKITTGNAVLLVDDKWHALLTPDGYGGPRYLLKKGRKFSAEAEFYKLDGKLYVRVRAVEKLL